MNDFNLSTFFSNFLHQKRAADSLIWGRGGGGGQMKAGGFTPPSSQSQFATLSAKPVLVGGDMKPDISVASFCVSPFDEE